MPPAKKPSDRNPKAILRDRPEETPGWDLLKDFSEVPVWDQTPLIAMVQNASKDSAGLSKEEYAKLSPEDRKLYQENPDAFREFDVNLVGELAKALLPFAKDPEAYTKFVSGKKAMTNAMNLAMAWVGQMGESESSETN